MRISTRRMASWSRILDEIIAMCLLTLDTYPVVFASLRLRDYFGHMTYVRCRSARHHLNKKNARSSAWEGELLALPWTFGCSYSFPCRPHRTGLKVKIFASD